MIFAANFKCNHTRNSTKSYIETLNKLLSNNCNHECFVFPPATALIDSTKNITIGTQNAYSTKNGAYTGEIGLEQLSEFSIKTILIGHSERREILSESQEVVAKKFQFFMEQGFKIIYCIGEPLEVREAGFESVMNYLAEQFVGIDISYPDLIVAYEPIWAIGTGRSATNDEITSTHKALKSIIKAPLLYGGSVNISNIKEIAEINEVDGVLVGSASLDSYKFYELLKSVN
jgi:triosephosphate isomerase